MHQWLRLERRELDVISFMDGVSLPSECTIEQVEQNAFYCGYKSDTIVYIVFFYDPNGKVFFAALREVVRMEL